MVFPVHILPGKFIKWSKSNVLYNLRDPVLSKSLLRKCYFGFLPKEQLHLSSQSRVKCKIDYIDI